MRCHYEVLNLNRDANSDEIKKAYRKFALVWHPDKNKDNIEEANKKFLEIQDAYETLIDDQERAWYDSHREVLLNGGLDGAKEQNYVYNVFPYFTSSCFKGYGDDEKSFYSVYRDVFNKIAEEDRDSYEEEDVEIPDFGNSTSDYDTVVAKFYAFWQSYCTPRSFVWCEEHDTREAQDRQVRRAMEKENKKMRDKAKKERNENVRNLVSFIRKKDKRVDEHKKFLEEKAKQAKIKSEEKREADRQKRLEQMKNYVEPEWMRNTEEKLGALSISNNDEAGESGDSCDSEEDEDEEEEDYFCVACDKSFKSDKAFKNHQKSKKHKENIELVKKTMKEEDLNLFFKNENEQAEESVEEEKTKNRLSKKQKKKNKLRSKNAVDEDDDGEEDICATATPIAEESNVQEEEEVKETDEAKRGKCETKDEASNTPAICSVCKNEFESRNKLFEHIKLEGHALIKTVPSQASSKSKTKKSKGKK